MQRKGKDFKTLSGTYHTEKAIKMNEQNLQIEALRYNLTKRRINRIFDKHNGKYASSRLWREAVINNLVAIWPNPSREELVDGILKRLFPFSVRDGLSLNSQLETFVNDIMQWATAPRHWNFLKKTWCEHIKFNHGNWVQLEACPSDYTNRVPDSWGQCPVEGCAAPRPDDA